MGDVGAVVSERHIEQVQRELRRVADAHGWPAPLAPAAGAALDRAWGRELHDEMNITPAHASREGVWAFLAVVVVPDLSLWRCSREEDRLLGVDRHVFARLWWRERVLGAVLVDGDGHTPLDEDEMVALFRRRYLVANREVARSIARTILHRGAPGPERLALMKRVTLGLLRLSPAVCLDILDADALDRLMGELVDTTTL